MYQMQWETSGADGVRDAHVRNLALNCTQTDALIEYAYALSREAASLQKASLLEMGVVKGEYVIKAALARYERDGL
jgi:hypothetical protein